MKKVVSVFLSLVLVLGLFAVAPVSASVYRSGDYYYELLDDGTAKIRRYSAPDVSADIPSYLDGYMVTSIGDGAFSGYSDLASVTIPDTVTTIGNYAFEGCENLISVGFGNAVTTIGYEAFSDCSSLIEVSFPDSVTSIDYYAFYQCSSLKSIIIPDSVTDIGMDAFYDTAWYENQTDGLVYAGRVAYKMKGNCPSEVEIKDGSLGIAGGAFFGCDSLASVIIPESVITIGIDAFYECQNLTSVVIPDSVITVGAGAFSLCTDLSSMTIGKSVKSIGSDAFSHCDNLISVTVPDSVTYIGNDAFYDCGRLSSVMIGSSVAEIGDEAFFDCGSLEEIIVDSNNAMYRSIDGSLYDKSASTMIQYAIGKSEASFTIPETVTAIGIRAFSGSQSLTNVTIPDTVITIGVEAFGACYNLNSIMIPESVTTIEGGAFAGCGLESVIIPNSVTSISEAAFSGCAVLTSVTIPESVTVIGERAFSYSGLTSIIIPKSVTNIGDDVFNGIRKDELTIFGDKSTVAEEYAKNNGFKFVALDEAPTEALTEIPTEEPTQAPTEVSTVITGTTGDCTWTLDGTELTVSGKGEMKDYNVFGAHFGPWGAYEIKSITVSDGVTSIGDGAFAYCNGIKSITIPDSVKRIGVCAFVNCLNLESVIIGSGVTSIKSEAFAYCSALHDINIPDNVISIDGSAFVDTKWLDRQPNGLIYAGKVAYGYKGDCPSNITIKEGALGIADKAFGNVSNLKSVVLPQSLKNIGSSAFYGTSLTGITIPPNVTDIGIRAFGVYFDWISEGYKPVNGFIVYGYSGTAAEKYAKDNNITFDSLDKPKLLATPKVTKVANTATGVSVAWSKSAGAAKYRIFRKTGSGSWAKLIDTTAVSIVDKTAKSGTKYAYTVRCIAKDGKSYTSDYDKTGKSILYLAQPKITKFENVANGIKLTFSKSTGAASYKVFVKSGSSWKGLGSVKTNTYTYTKAKSGTTYVFTVRAVSKDGKTLSSYNTTGWKQKFVVAPALPTLKNTKNGVQVTIKKVAGAEKYRIFRKVGNGKFAKLADTTKLTYVDKTAKNGKTYSYTVRCISKDGKTYTSAYNTKGKSIKCKR